MLILTLRTDKPEAEIGLYEDDKQLAYQNWQAHRELAETIHAKIRELLTQGGHQLSDIQGMVVFQGPGSFTGLRIGLSVANTLAYALAVPVVATAGDDWIREGVKRLDEGDNEKIVLPNYGADPKTTEQRK